MITWALGRLLTETQISALADIFIFALSICSHVKRLKQTRTKKLTKLQGMQFLKFVFLALLIRFFLFLLQFFI